MPKAMQTKAMFDGFEKALNRPSLASKSHQIDTRVRMSRDNKAQFSLALGTFEPEPRDREGVAHPLKKHLLPPFTVAVKLL